MKRTLLLTTLAALLLAACDAKVYYDRAQTVDEHGWLPAETVDFDVEAPDTTTVFDFLFEVRNSISYPYANTFLFVQTTFPDGSVAHDTLEVPLADADGRWLGKRTGRYVDVRRYLYRNARFPMEGRYRFSVANGMRDSAIAGLKNIGMRIEYSNMK